MLFAGGLVFGVALYRARVLARWAAALLAVSGVITIALAVMSDAFYRLLAWPRLLAVDHVRHRHQDEPSTVDGLPATQRCHPRVRPRPTRVVGALATLLVALTFVTAKC